MMGYDVQYAGIGKQFRLVNASYYTKYITGETMEILLHECTACNQVYGTKNEAGEHECPICGHVDVFLDIEDVLRDVASGKIKPEQIQLNSET